MLPRRLLFLLTLFLICAVPTATAWMIAPYDGPPPDWFSRPAKAAPVRHVKDEARVPIEPLPVRRVTVEAYRLDPPVKKAAISELVRPAWACTLTRQAVERFGRDAVRKFLRDKGHAKPEIDEAMQCLSRRT